MQDDPAITRIHEVCHRISKQFDHDPKKLVEHYMRLQAQHIDRLLGQWREQTRRWQHDMRLQAQHIDRLLGLAKGEDNEKAPTQA